MGLAGVATYLWNTSEVASDWWPNVATMSVEIAATITIVDWVVGRQQSQRNRPRTANLYYWLGLGTRGFVGAAAVDYVEVHRRTFKPLPDTVLAFLDQWEAGHEHEDVARAAFKDDDGPRHAPMLVLEAVEEASKMRKARERDLDVMPPDLVRALDDFTWAAAQASQLCGFPHRDDAERGERYKVAASYQDSFWIGPTLDPVAVGEQL